MLKPTTSLKALETEDDEYDDLSEMLYKTLDQDQLVLLINIRNDKKRFEKYKKKVHSIRFNGRKFDKFETLERESQSNVSMFNFQTAFFGYWVINEFINLYDFNIPLIIALSMAHPIADDEWKVSVNSLIDLVDYLIERSEDLSKYVEKLSVQK